MNPSGINDMQAPADMPLPETGNDALPEQPMDEDQVCVDVQALAMPDEKEQLEPPAPGDKVQMNIEGTVERVTPEGKAYVTMTAVNGQEVKEDEPADQEPTEDQQMASLQSDVGKLPEGY